MGRETMDGNRDIRVRRLFVAEGINTAIQLRRASAKKSSDIMLSTGTSGSSPRRLL